jgi:hypothetical protein
MFIAADTKKKVKLPNNQRLAEKLPVQESWHMKPATDMQRK